MPDTQPPAAHHLTPTNDHIDPASILEAENKLKEAIPSIATRIEPKELKTLAMLMVSEHTTQVSYSGPLPPSAEVQRYDQYIPGGGDRLMKQVENQAEHRQTLEKIVVRSREKRADRGQWMGLIFGVICLTFALVLGLNGQPVLAGVIAGTTMLAGIGIFITGKIIESPVKK